MSVNIAIIEAAYQPLRVALQKHGLFLTHREMEDILEAVGDVNEKLDEIWKVESECDVDGCHKQSTNGGCYWKEAGYWRLCSEHFTYGFQGNQQPPMKQSALDREVTRNKQTGNLPSEST